MSQKKKSTSFIQHLPGILLRSWLEFVKFPSRMSKSCPHVHVATTSLLPIVHIVLDTCWQARMSVENPNFTFRSHQRGCQSVIEKRWFDWELSFPNHGRTHFHPKKVSSNYTFIQELFRPKPFQVPKGGGPEGRSPSGVGPKSRNMRPEGWSPNGGPLQVGPLMWGPLSSNNFLYYFPLLGIFSYPNVHIWGPGLQKHHQNSTRSTQERKERKKIAVEEGKKKSEILGGPAEGVQGRICPGEGDRRELGKVGIGHNGAGQSGPTEGLGF